MLVESFLKLKITVSEPSRSSDLQMMHENGLQQTASIRLKIIILNSLGLKFLRNTIVPTLTIT